MYESPPEFTRTILDNSLLEFLKETRGYSTHRIRHKRGKKVTYTPGTQITPQNHKDIQSTDIQQEILEDEPAVESPFDGPSTIGMLSITNEPPAILDDPSTSGIPSTLNEHPEKDQASSEEDTPLAQFVRKRRKKSKGKENENLCYISKCDFRFYFNARYWIRCITCSMWVCGVILTSGPCS
ncbi:unnamed protein product [Diatraea saccharalis]|uniref:Uncharacterized protein n=1 Tax=Diatraea saccharalis TaxID=40085 RepID=A0A9N9RCE7_9NEOP|nr:unnamed protein product [Diatraea saccharalis]